MSKKIYIDGLGLVEGHFSGIGQYILGVLRGIDEILDDKKIYGEDHPEVIVLIPYDSIARFRTFKFKNIKYRRLPFKFRYTAALWHRRKMPPLDLMFGRGVYIFPRFVDMNLAFSKSALVIYDLSYELHREYSDEKNAQFLSEKVKASVAKTNRIITISKNARNEIADFYNVNKNEVTVAYPAVDQKYFFKHSEEYIEKIKQKYGINGDYIITLSNLEPRKNLEAVIDAYCDLPKSITDKVGLVLVGVNGWKFEKLFEKIIEKVNQGYNIQRPSHYIDDLDKPAILSGAKLLAYPSHYEGFGMPPLEALACGTPVITADNSSLPEVVKGTGKMVKSHDTKALRNAMKDILENYEKIAKETMVSGPKRAEEFSWKESARKFLDIAEELSK